MRQLTITPRFTDRSESSFEKYLTEVAGMKDRLTIEEEEHYGKMLLSNDPDKIEKAKEVFVKSNLRFVISVAKQFHAGQTLTISDLVQAGNIGLVKAAERFDYSKGFKFISYAVWWIRQSIMEQLAEQGKIVRLPSNQHANINKFKNAERKLNQALGREPSFEEMYEEVISEAFIKKNKKKGVDVHSEEFDLLLQKEVIDSMDDIKKFETLMMADAKPQALDGFLDDEDRGGSRLVDLMESDSFEHMEDELIESDMKLALKRIMNQRLGNREVYILEQYYGLTGEEPKTLEEIGQSIGLGKERIRQLKDKAEKKLKTNRVKKELLS